MCFPPAGRNDEVLASIKQRARIAHDRRDLVRRPGALRGDRSARFASELSGERQLKSLPATSQAIVVMLAGP
jgi:hypothetical protein